MKKPALASILFAGAMLAVAVTAEAQQPKKIPRIGYLAIRSGPSPSGEAFLDGLRSLRYIEGQTIAIEWRYAQQRFDRLPELLSG